MSANGRYALLRTYSDVHLYDAKTWKAHALARDSTQQQGESIALERSQRSFLIGSEGANSALIRMPLTLPRRQRSRTPTANAEPDHGSAAD